MEKVAKVKAHQRYDGYPGATTILNKAIAKPFLVKWANNLGLQGIDSSKYVDELADVGTLAHKRIESICSQYKIGNGWVEGPEMQEEYDKYSPINSRLSDYAVSRFMKWTETVELAILGTEVQLSWPEQKYGGTLDLIAKVDGTIELIDLKTSKKIYDSHWYQIASYFRLGATIYGLKRARILNIPRTEDEGQFLDPVMTEEQLEPYWEVFLRAKDLYYALRKVGA